MPGNPVNSIPTSLRIAIGFAIAIWIVGLTALVFGAPGEIVVATAALGTVGAFVEWRSHKSADRPADGSDGGPADAPAFPLPGDAGDTPVAAQMRYEAEPEGEFHRKH